MFHILRCRIWQLKHFSLANHLIMLNKFRSIFICYFIGLACFVMTASICSGQKLSINPLDSLVDELLQIKITGLRPRQPVIIRASITDSNDKHWQSYAGFYADNQGVVDLSTQPPANGTYNGVDVMGLITSMNLPNPDHDRARFTYRRSYPLTFHFTVEIDGKIVAETDVTRRFMRVNAKMTDVRENNLVGTLFTPNEEGVFPAVIVLGGSEGGFPDDVAAMLSSRGFAALSLAYFGAENLPSSLEEIPLEYFKLAIDFLKRQPFVRKKSIGILGTSKGAEAALLIASQSSDIRAVVGYVPSSVVWSCLCNTPGKSSWSLDGKSLPFIPHATDPTYRPPAGFPLSPAINFAYRLQNQDAIARAAIPVEKINGPVLLISGKEDGMWKSFAMAQMILDRLKKNGSRFPNQHLAYESAGHLIGKAFLPTGSTVIGGGRIMTGGTSAANARAQKDSWTQVVKFLQASLR
jgi:dienelactone hydrolase